MTQVEGNFFLLFYLSFICLFTLGNRNDCYSPQEKTPFSLRSPSFYPENVDPLKH